MTGRSGRTRRLGCNLLWLVPSVVGGSEEYTVGLLRAVRTRPHAGVELVLFATPALLEAYPDLASDYEVVQPPHGWHTRGRRVLAENSWLPRATSAAQVSVVHHMGGTMPWIRNVTGLVTIHDLQPWSLPEHFSRLKRAYLQATVPGSVRRALAVITLTNWARDDLASRFSVDPARIEVVGPGCNPPVGTRPSELRRTLEAYDLVDRPFVLFPAITYPHKNHEVLVRAFARVADRHPDAVLVLTGGEGPTEGAVRALVADLGVASQVRRTGRIPADHLDLLYRAATALAFPSRYEGFGLPVLEAMSQRCPVIAARAGALPEVVGDGGLVLEADDVGGWARAIDTLLDDHDSRDRAAAAAAARAGAFSWSASADHLIDLYRRALDRAAA